MKVVILAGGFGTRFSEETELKPKPMIEIGGKPILWHIMKLYSHYGYNDFVICLGYKGYVIKEYFHNYFLHHSNVTIDLKSNNIQYHTTNSEPWKVTLIDTGLNSMTGSRIKKIREYIDGDSFMLTYGDGVANVNIKELVDFHKQHNKVATVTAVQPVGRFGALEIENSTITKFKEKPVGDGSWINGGFFVLSKDAFDYISDEESEIWEQEPLKKLSESGNLKAFIHNGFWKPMDTLRDKKELEKLWENKNPPWKVW